MVCVSRHVGGCFVADMVQHQRHRTIKEAATIVMRQLLTIVTGGELPPITNKK